MAALPVWEEHAQIRVQFIAADPTFVPGIPTLRNETGSRVRPSTALIRSRIIRFFRIVTSEHLQKLILEAMEIQMGQSSITVSVQFVENFQKHLFVIAITEFTTCSQEILQG